MKTPNNRMETGRETREKHPCVHKKIWPGSPVDYNPSVCPNCGSGRNAVVKTFAAIPTSDGAVQNRHHDCHNCGTRFTTAQRVPPCDVKYCRTDEGVGG